MLQCLCMQNFLTTLSRNSQQKNGHRGKKGFAIGILFYIPPGAGEIYDLRLLLNVQNGCTCYEDVMTVNGVVYAIFQVTCYAFGLLEDDKEFIEGMNEASARGSGHYLRVLSVTLLLSNSMSRPDIV